MLVLNPSFACYANKTHNAIRLRETTTCPSLVIGLVTLDPQDRLRRSNVDGACSRDGEHQVVHSIQGARSAVGDGMRHAAAEASGCPDGSGGDRDRGLVFWRGALEGDLNVVRLGRALRAACGSWSCHGSGSHESNGESEVGMHFGED